MSALRLSYATRAPFVLAFFTSCVKQRARSRKVAVTLMDFARSS